MADAFLGQLMLFAGTFIPKGWMACDGRLLSITQFSGLYSVIGNTYPGGSSTQFALPDMRGRVPVGAGQGLGLQYYAMGAIGGAENVTLQTAQMPTHNHGMQASNAQGDSTGPAGNYLAETTDSSNTYSTYASSISSPGNLAGDAITSTGGSQGHPNLQPYSVLQWCICVAGIFPPRGGT